MNVARRGVANDRTTKMTSGGCRRPQHDRATSAREQHRPPDRPESIRRCRLLPPFTEITMALASFSPHQFIISCTSYIASLSAGQVVLECSEALVVNYHVTSCHVMLASPPDRWCWKCSESLVVKYHVMSCHVMLSCRVRRVHDFSCHAKLRPPVGSFVWARYGSGLGLRRVVGCRRGS